MIVKRVSVLNTAPATTPATPATASAAINGTQPQIPQSPNFCGASQMVNGVKIHKTSGLKSLAKVLGLSGLVGMATHLEGCSKANPVSIETGVTNKVLVLTEKQQSAMNYLDTLLTWAKGTSNGTHEVKGASSGVVYSKIGLTSNCKNVTEVYTLDTAATTNSDSLVYGCKYTDNLMGWTDSGTTTFTKSDSGIVTKNFTEGITKEFIKNSDGTIKVNHVGTSGKSYYSTWTSNGDGTVTETYTEGYGTPCTYSDFSFENNK